MRFGHFKRYYLELDYDWEKLRFLPSVLRGCFAGEVGAFCVPRRSDARAGGELRRVPPEPAAGITPGKNIQETDRIVLQERELFAYTRR